MRKPNQFIRKLTDKQVVDLCIGDSVLNKARQEFSRSSAHIEQQSAQRHLLAPIEMRRLELEAVINIIEAGTERAYNLEAATGIAFKDIPTSRTGIK